MLIRQERLPTCRFNDMRKGACQLDINKSCTECPDRGACRSICNADRLPVITYVDILLMFDYCSTFHRYTKNESQHLHTIKLEYISTAVSSLCC